MEITLYAKFMALAWTTGELLCLVFLRWLFFYLSLDCKLRRQTAFLLSCGTGYVLLMWMLYRGEDIFYPRLDICDSIGWLCLSLLWKFFLTLWVFIEGVCMLYALRIYHLMKPKVAGVKSNSNIHTTTLYTLAAGIFLFIIFLFYFFYHFHAIHVFQKYGLTASDLDNMSKFYIRICGVFFIIIEWTIGIIMFKGYVLLKRIDERN